MLIEALNLSKQYGDILACDNICLSLTEGQVFGLLGPNGAGKSTLVKMFLGQVHPTAGQALIQGKSVKSKNSRRMIGYLPELFRHYEWLTAYEMMHYYARFYGMPARNEKAAIMSALELVGLRGREKEKIERYSKGMQQRLGLAGAILHQPAILFLDEPTSALDPIGRREIRDIIAVLKNQGTTILLNSHLLGEVEMTCSHLGFINKGQLFATGKIEDFIGDQHEIEIEAEDIPVSSLREWQAEGRILQKDEHHLRMHIQDRREIPAIIAALAAGGASIYRVDYKTKGLEEVFLDLIEH